MMDIALQSKSPASRTARRRPSLATLWLGSACLSAAVFSSGCVVQTSAATPAETAAPTTPEKQKKKKKKKKDGENKGQGKGTKKASGDSTDTDSDESRASAKKARKAKRLKTRAAAIAASEELKEPAKEIPEVPEGIQGSLQLVPENAAAVAFADLASLRGSLLMKGLLSRAREEVKGEARKDFDQLGIDLEKDLNSVVAVLGNDGDDEGLLILELAVDENKLLEALRKHQKQVDSASFGEEDYYILDRDGALAVTGTRVIFGRVDMVRAAIATAAGEAPASTMAKDAFKQHQGWPIVISAKPTAEMRTQLQDEASIGGSMLGGYLRVNPKSGLEADSEIEFSNADDAARIVAEYTKFKATMLSRLPPDLQKVLSTLRVGADGGKLSVQWTVSETDLGVLMEL